MVTDRDGPTPGVADKLKNSASFLNNPETEGAMPKRMTKSRKRPCRICGRWFTPNPRSGDRQKTCASMECKRRWHAQACRRWNRKNRSYYQEIYLAKRLEAESSRRPDRLCGRETVSCPQRASPLKIPRETVQDVIGAQPLVIIEYMARLLRRSFQDVIRAQVFGIQGEFSRLSRDFISRRDSQSVS